MILDWLSSVWPWLLGALDIALATAATIHAVLWKRDSRAAIAWAGLAWLAPLVGSLAYFCFGVNRIQRKAVSLRLRQVWMHRKDHATGHSDSIRRDELASQYPSLVGLATLGRRLTGRPVLPGNQVEVLINGDEAFPAMLEAIAQAKRSVALMSYIFDSDQAGELFLEALVRANDRGVLVRVLIDDVGSRYSSPNMVRRLCGAGVQAAAFLPTRIPRLFQYANLRNHRKILVVDGRVGFTGGTNIREGHWLSRNPAAPVQCVHFHIKGPVVGQLQEVFAIDWAFASGESLDPETWFSEPEHCGSVWARGIPDGPDEDFEKIADTIVGALSVARHEVHILTPYFLPHAALIHALNVASMRGVDVRIYIPEKTNVPIVTWAAAAQLWQILEKGCRVFLTRPPFDHTKLMVVDGAWSLIGSSNWDPRSLRLNFEFNVECYDHELARRLDQLISVKQQRSRELRLDEINNRGFPIRLRDGLARLATPYL